MKNVNTYLAIALVLVVGAIIISVTLGSGDSKKSEAKTPDITQTKPSEIKIEPQATAEQPKTDTKPTATDLKIEVLKQGTGTVVTKVGDMISVHYTGTLADGTKFDSSLDRGTPFKFDLGAGQVIKGWDQGLTGMKVGEKRRLTVPPSLGYGDQAMGTKIPANSTLIFEVELLEILPNK